MKDENDFGGFWRRWIIVVQHVQYGENRLTPQKGSISS
jgi:hypothetical protein